MSLLNSAKPKLVIYLFEFLFFLTSFVSLDVRPKENQEVWSTEPAFTYLCKYLCLHGENSRNGVYRN